MSERIEILKLVDSYRAEHKEAKGLSNAQIISILSEVGVIKLSKSEKISIFGEQSESGLGDSVSLGQSGARQDKTVVVQLSDGKTYDINQIITERINKVSENLQKAEDRNGFIGSAWSWIKNTAGIGDSSDDVREAQTKEKQLLQQFNNEKKRPEIFKELTGVDYTPENLEKFIKGEIKLKSERALSGYEEGQDMATDVGADIVSGIAAVGIYTASVAAVPFTGGASIAVGLSAATASAAAIKTGLKAADAAVGGREYTLDDAKRDAATGGFSGILAPVTGGMGGAIGKTAATKLGIQVIKQTGKSTLQQTAKGGIKKSVETALLNPTGYEYIGGNVVKRAAAQAAEMATDGAIGGAVDNAFRTAYDGGGAEEVLQAATEGFVGGAIMSPVIGGGMKGVGVAFNRIKGIDEFSSLVTNCKNLSDDDLLNLYQYYKNYEKECLANNKPVPDMKQAGFDKLMEEMNLRLLNPDMQNTKLPYKRPANMTVEQILEKLNSKLELKSNPICQDLLEKVSRDDFSAQQKQVYLTFLDLVISNEALANNQSLQLAAKKGLLFINNPESLKIFEGFVNNPDIQNNKYISDALWPIAELLSYADRSFVSNVIQKFRTGDMSVVSDILENDGNLKNYYFGIPLSFANKQIEDLSQQERDILRNWIYTQRDKPLSSNLLSGVYPAVPTTSEEFINTVLKLNEIEHINTTALEPAKITEFKNNLLNLASGKAEHDDVAKITSLMPEIFNDGKKISEETLRQLRQISASRNFNLLSEKDKIIVIMSVILKDTDDNLLNLSRKTVDIAQRFGFSKYDSEKIANVICCSNLISDFMKTTKNTVKYELNNNQKIITNNRREFFDNAAFLLKDGNTFELAKMVYSLHERDGLTRYLDKMLANKIKEYKSHDFMMPQTPKSSYHAKARSVEVNKNGKIYHVRVVNRSEIENFCGYLHTPENVSSRKDASLMQNIAKFMLAGNGNLSERIVCACYVDATSKSFVNNSYNYGLGSGLILKVSNNKQYVGAGSDISSLEKNRKELIQSYYNENDLINTGMNVPDGTKMHKLRTLISDNLKKILGVDDNEYVQRIDNIKEELGDEVLSMERLREIDPEMADAYKEFLSARILDKNDFNNAVLRDDYEWNEFLISEAKINDFYTTHLDKMPEEYLEIASNPDNDIVIVLMYD